MREKGLPWKPRKDAGESARARFELARVATATPRSPHDLTEEEAARAIRAIECKIRILQSKKATPEEKLDILAWLGAMTGIAVRNVNTLLWILWDIDLEKSKCVQDWIEDGREEGRSKGRRAGRKEGRIEVWRLAARETIRGRFDSVPADVAERIEALRDPARLKRLVRAAAEAATIDAFRAAL